MKGKSLSIICGALTWLKDHEKKNEEEVQKILSGEATKAQYVEKFYLIDINSSLTVHVCEIDRQYAE